MFRGKKGRRSRGREEEWKKGGREWKKREHRRTRRDRASCLEQTDPVLQFAPGM